MLLNVAQPKRKSTRLKMYDYSLSGIYFITIRIKNYDQWFGKIDYDRMVLNQFGMIVKQQWFWMGKQYPNINLDEFVIMPDHFHGIIIIEREGHAPPLRQCISLCEMIGAFKSTTSKLIHRAGYFKFQWQRSFYDRIIRNDDALKNIRIYIQNNPMNWKKHQKIQNI